MINHQSDGGDSEATWAPLNKSTIHLLKWSSMGAGSQSTIQVILIPRWPRQAILTNKANHGHHRSLETAQGPCGSLLPSTPTEQRKIPLKMKVWLEINRLVMVIMLALY